MIMEIAETATKRIELPRFDRTDRTPTRDVTMRLEALAAHSEQKAAKLNSADKELIRKLAACSLFQDYQEAFSEATGLPLTLRAVDEWQLAHAGDRRQNAFCALVAKHNPSCAACLQMQKQVCNTANGVPATLKCSFGLNETAVTVKLGDRTIGYLQTGQVFFKATTATQTSTAVSRLKKLGPTINTKEATNAYQDTRVMRRQQYDSAVRLLEIFAKQLSLVANQIALQEQVAEPPQVARARQFIHEHWEDELSLGDVAKHAAISPFYLCKKFKEVTGLHFTDYVSRVRVEKAKELLRNPNHRISEVAYQTGFQSLSHFNRCFKRITGESPTACRQQLQTI
jgi:AraC-like DNA-binding protein/ligand-binding sensor protein